MTIGISDRLKLIADQVSPGSAVADIGTDHGYLPIYLAENGISEKIIMTDVSRPSLDKAVEDVSATLGEDDRIEARAGDGLGPLESGECDTVIIAGMGGLLMIDILDWDITKTRTFANYIFQPRRNAGDLRKWLSIHGFAIGKNLLVRERDHICEVITAKPSQGNYLETEDVPDIVYEYPDGAEAPYEQGLVSEYYNDELEKARFILGKIRGSSEGSQNKERYFESKIERLEELCRKTVL